MKNIVKILFTAIIIAISIPILNFLINFQNEPRGTITNKTFVSYSDLFFNYEVSRYPSSVEVLPIQLTQEKVLLGMSVDPWNLNFGIIPAGNNSAKRFINLVNLKEKDFKVILKAYGNISSFVKFSKNNFLLHPKENVTVEAIFYAEKAKVGNYTGIIDVIIKKPKYDFLYSFLK